MLADEKGLSMEDISETLNTALAAAYRKDFGEKNQNVMFKFDLDSGDMKVWDEKVVVDFADEHLEQIKLNGLDKKWVEGMVINPEGEVVVDDHQRRDVDEVAEGEEEKLRYNPKTDILLEEAKKINKKYKVGDTITTDLPVPTEFGRMAAQTAKQVIIQKLREVERERVFTEFEDKAGELLNAFVSRKDGRNVLIDLGKATAIMTPDQQVRGEKYNIGDRVKVYVMAVEKTARGPHIAVSRAHPKVIAKLFETEIPEIEDGSIQIKSIAREAGYRSKVAVYTEDESIDPIGSCVGQRGARIQTIIAELGGEKIDIIEWSDDAKKFIAAALSPAKVSSVDVLVEPKEGVTGEATAFVPEDQLSLAIGKEGQNVRLAAKLTGWKINVAKAGAPAAEVVEAAAPEEVVADESVEEEA